MSRRQTLETSLWCDDPGPAKTYWDSRVFKRMRRRLAKASPYPDLRKQRPEQFRAAAIWAAMTKLCCPDTRGEPNTVLADFWEVMRDNVVGHIDEPFKTRQHIEAVQEIV